jgi:GxxExxY protein
MSELIYKEESYQIIGLCMEIHKLLGHGFAESFYKEALEYEFNLNGVNYERNKLYTIDYKGHELKQKFVADIVVLNKIIIMIKAQEDGIDDHVISETINFLKVSKCKLGLIINFARKSLEHKRLVY